MTQKERLFDLIQCYSPTFDDLAEDMADFLIGCGVIVPPCKVGDEVFWNNGMYVEVYKVKGFIVDSENMFRLDLGCFEPIFPHPEGRLAFTRQAAEQALKERGT